jgi:SAM-dependent methyltransferase
MHSDGTLTLSSVGVEALDNPATDPALVARMLRDIARCNRWLGGAAAMQYGLAQLFTPADRGASLSVFDIGTGAGDLPRAAVRWGARRGVAIRPLGLERIATAASLAQRNGVTMVLGCAGALPLRAGSVDIVLVSQVAHHLDRDSTIRLVAACNRLARRGVIIADLHQRWFAAPGFRLAGPLLGLHATTVDDGVTSLRRGYTVPSLRGLCVEAGIADVHVTARPGARVVAWWRKP